MILVLNVHEGIRIECVLGWWSKSSSCSIVLLLLGLVTSLHIVVLRLVSQVEWHRLLDCRWRLLCSRLAQASSIDYALRRTSEVLSDTITVYVLELVRILLVQTYLSFKKHVAEVNDFWNFLHV